jgi:hypothetical protein
VGSKIQDWGQLLDRKKGATQRGPTAYVMHSKKPRDILMEVQKNRKKVEQDGAKKAAREAKAQAKADAKLAAAPAKTAVAKKKGAAKKVEDKEAVPARKKGPRGARANESKK